MRKSLLALIIVMIMAPFASAGVLDTLKTPAEESGWARTSTSQEVVDFCKLVAENSEGRIRYEEMGVTVYGKPLPLAVVGVPFAPMTRAGAGDRIVIHIQCNIHSGEVEGKDGMLQFLREVALGQHDELLKDVVLLVNPNFNPDGNDTFGAWRSNSQPTPALIGTRTNAQGFNLNRDFVKADSPEVRGFLKVFRKWDPEIFIDEHATDGTRHRHPVAYGYGQNPNNDQAFETANRLFAESIFGVGIGQYATPADNFFRTYMGQVLVNDPSLADGRRPPLTESTRAIPYMESYGGNTTFVTISNDEGKDERRPTRLTSGNGDGVRYASNLPTIKNRIGLLFECHSHNEYRYRVHTQYAATISTIQQATRQKDSIQALIRAQNEAAANRTSLNQATDVVYLSSPGLERVSWDLGYGPGLIDMEGFRYAANASGDRTSTTIDPNADAAWDNLEIWSQFRLGDSVPMGSLYILDGAAQSSVEFLLRHGVKVYRLKEDVVLSGTHQKFYNPANARGNWAVAHQANAYEGHFPVNTSAIVGDWQPLDDQEVSKGHYVVSTAQPYGTFAAFMLEPKANDGLCYWNFWDSQLFTTENSASGSFDIRKTYSYLAISSDAMEQVFLSEDSEDPGISPPRPFTEAQILDETGANSAVAVSQSGASLTVKIPAGSDLIDGETVWFWFNRVSGNGTVTPEGAAAKVVNLDADGSATVVFDLKNIDGEGTSLPEGDYAIEYLGTDSGASGYTPYSGTHVNPVSDGQGDDDDDKGGKSSSSGCYTGFGIISLLSAACFFAAGRKPRAKR